jgi:hypothetical protein
MGTNTTTAQYVLIQLHYNNQVCRVLTSFTRWF